MNSSLEIASGAAARDLDELMNRLRTEVAERKRLAGEAMPGEPLKTTAEHPATGKWTARQLLALPAADFARGAHLAFFGREPSPDEFVRLRDRLLVEGVGRMRILREFRRSPEARAGKRPVEGLTQEFVRDRVYWSPPAKFGRAIGRGARNLWLLPRYVRKFLERVDALDRRAAEITAALRNVQSAQTNDRQNLARQLRRLDEAAEAARNKTAARLDDVQRRNADEIGDAKARLGRAETRLVDHWRTIIEHRFELQNLLIALQGSADRSVAANSLAPEIARDTSHLLDPLYLSFEDRYRGTRDDIKERQRVYIARVQAAWAECGNAPAVDIGCGRGEWLELLSEAAIAARGYDLNRVAIEECRERGLDAELRDGLAAMAQLPANSCSAVTCFHVIEHLAFEVVVELLDHALRVLRPGGVLILETPNPANLLVAAERFYLDPTHRNPLPSELTSYLLQARGFEDVEILPLHPVQSDGEEQPDDPMLRLLQQKLFGPQDYGAIGRKSA